MEVAAGTARARAMPFARRGGFATPSYLLRLPVAEIVRLVRAEAAATGGAPELFVDAYRDYIVEEEYDRGVYGLHDAGRFDLVTAEAVLNIEPRLEQNYWVLSVIIHRDLGPQPAAEEAAFAGGPLTLDAFEAEFLARPGAQVSVRLQTQTALAKAHFEQWWAGLNTRHPRAGAAGPGEDASPAPAQDASGRNLPMPPDPPAAEAWSYRAREAVAVFPGADALEAAVTDLEMSGFDRAAISVLGSDQAGRECIGRLYRSVAEIEDDARAPQSAFVSRGSRLEGEAAAVTFPFFIGGIVGAAGVVGSGGALAGAIAATVLGGVTGAGLGGLLARAIALRHAHRVEEQVRQGGLVLWVSVADADRERRALAILQKNGGRDVHVHDVERQWGPAARPLSDAQVDPLLLGRDPPET